MPPAEAGREGEKQSFAGLAPELEEHQRGNGKAHHDRAADEVVDHRSGILVPDETEQQHKILSIPYALKKLGTLDDAIEFVRVITQAVCAGIHPDPRSFQIWTSWAYREIDNRYAKLSHTSSDAETLAEVKATIIQEVLTLVVFSAFVIFWRGEELRWNYIAAFVLIVGAVALVFCFQPEKKPEQAADAAGPAAAVSATRS